MLLPGDAIAQGQQRVHEVDVLEEHALLLGGQLHIGEIPEAADAQADEPVGQGLGHVLRHGQHRHVGLVVGHIFLQLVHGAHRHAADLRADEGGGDVEGGVDAEADLVKVEVLQQGVAQMARADDDEPVALVDAQNMADLGAQLRHVVAVALLAELAEAAQILPYLRGGDVHLRPQGVRADAYHTLVIQVIQVAVVAGQPVDHSIGDFLFFHIETLFGLEYGAKHRNLVAILQQVRRVVNFFNNLSAKNFLENGFTSAGRTAIIPRVE